MSFRIRNKDMVAHLEWNNRRKRKILHWFELKKFIQFQLSIITGNLPVCIRWWTVNRWFWVNVFPHTSHSYGRAPVWTTYIYYRLLSNWDSLMEYIRGFIWPQWTHLWHIHLNILLMRYLPGAAYKQWGLWEFFHRGYTGNFFRWLQPKYSFSFPLVAQDLRVVFPSFYAYDDLVPFLISVLLHAYIGCKENARF